MTAFVSWYLLITLLGWLTFPLTYTLFPPLAVVGVRRGCAGAGAAPVGAGVAGAGRV